MVMKHLHEMPLGGHSGFHKTLQRVKTGFFWTGLQSFAKQYIRECTVCQKMKGETMSPARLLQPLLIPKWHWTEICMDFIEGIPRSQGCEIIFVAVDHLSKYNHFIPLNHPYTASSMARVFMDNVFKLHGMPLSIVSDHDSVFTSTFWRELVNHCLKTYLRCSMGTRLSDWTCWLSLAEWWYNSSVHSTTWMSPSEAVYFLHHIFSLMLRAPLA